MMWANVRNWLRDWARRREFAARGVRIGRGSYVSPAAEIGDFTRINAASHIGPCKIGACCAIGGRLVVRSSNHNYHYPNVQDHFQKNIVQSSLRVIGQTKGAVEIGNAVWIGDSVIILSGVHVGDGAVIGAGSVVTRNVPPYAIAVGNPARVIKYRFAPEIIDLIKDIHWWAWPTGKVMANREFFETDLSGVSTEQLRLILSRIA